MENCEYALEIWDAGKRSGGIVATNHVNIKVRQGRISGITDPNGAGKTTLLNMITGVYKPTEGDVMLYGRSIAGKLPYEIACNGIARTFQNIRLFGDLSVYENAHIVYQKNMTHNLWEDTIKNRKYKEEERIHTNRCGETLKDMGSWEVRGYLAGNLPYGMQRRLETMRALAASSRILLSDEPATGMNEDESVVLAGITREIIGKNKEITILVINHHMDVTMNVCDEVTVINLDRQLATGGSEEMQGNQEVIDAYLGVGD